MRKSRGGAGWRLCRSRRAVGIHYPAGGLCRRCSVSGNASDQRQRQRHHKYHQGAHRSGVHGAPLSSMRGPAAWAAEKFATGTAAKARIASTKSMRIVASTQGLPLSSMRAPAAQDGSGTVVKLSEKRTEMARIRARIGILENQIHHMRYLSHDNLSHVKCR